MLLSPWMPDWTCPVESWGKQLQEQQAGYLCWEVNDYPPCVSQGCTWRQEMRMSRHGVSPHPWVVPAPALPWVPGPSAAPLPARRLLHPCTFGKKASVLGTERRVFRCDAAGTALGGAFSCAGILIPSAGWVLPTNPADADPAAADPAVRARRGTQRDHHRGRQPAAVNIHEAAEDPGF